ncbi:MAG: dephospho-CoA kinase [Deltaproteobacteria bacterium]|jgi:dephospho-CoA kinase|nr:dephospho-CoA kinase [Deltaproteobacteria bacterium]
MPDPPKLIPREPDPSPPPWAIDPEGLLESQPGKIRVAITGGIASGKSTVMAVLSILDAQVIDFDVICHQAYDPVDPTYNQILELFGSKALDKNGSLDRSAIAKLIFKDAQKKAALEAILHPYAWNNMLLLLKRFQDFQLIAIDIPLLYEANLASLFYPVALIFVSPESQIQRLLARNPKSNRRDAEKILKNQLPIVDKVRRADYVLNNEGSIRDLIYQSKELFTWLKNLVPKKPTRR